MRFLIGLAIVAMLFAFTNGSAFARSLYDEELSQLSGITRSLMVRAERTHPDDKSGRMAIPGYSPDDTGYENIITGGMLLGLSHSEIMRKIPDIDEFSGLGEYLGLPARTYSSGMLVRLGFALATVLDPDVLLMDEGISAGDAQFAERAKQRMQGFISRASIMVVASHSNDLILSSCNKAAIMSAGRIVSFGPVGGVLEDYDAIIHGRAMKYATM